MSGQFGIQNTKDVFQLAGTVTSLILRKKKALTLVEFMLSDEFRTAIIDAVSGITEVPKEVRDLQADEVFELFKVFMSTGEKVMKDLKAG